MNDDIIRELEKYDNEETFLRKKIPLSPDLINLYLEIPLYCRKSLSKITPGWGYVGPIVRNGLHITTIGKSGIKIDLKQQSADSLFESNNTDRILVDEILKHNNWEQAEHLHSICFSQKRSTHLVNYPAWITGNLEALLFDASDLLSSCHTTPCTAYMNPGIDQVTIGFKTEEDEDIFATGKTFLETGIRLYIKAWALHHSFQRPSLSDLPQPIEVDSSYNQEPTITILSYSSLYSFFRLEKYCTWTIDFDQVKSYRATAKPGYLGTGKFLEGTFHLVYAPDNKKGQGYL